MSTADTSDVTTVPCPEFPTTSLTNTSDYTPISSLAELSDRVTQILSTTYSISQDRSLPLTKEILSWIVDRDTFESDAKVFIETLAQPTSREGVPEPKALNLHNALGVVFDRQQEMDSENIDHCWRTVVAGLILTSSGRLYGSERPRSDEELRTWLAQTQVNLDIALQQLGVESTDDAVMKLTEQVSQLLLEWQHLVHTLNPTDMTKMAFALRNYLQRRRVNPKEYWSQRRFTRAPYDAQVSCYPDGIYTAIYH
jgi:hypothetical protein